MTDDRVAMLNDFAKDRHPGLVGIEVLSCEANLVTGRLPMSVLGRDSSFNPTVVRLKGDDIGG